jgi:hypothetical protein
VRARGGKGGIEEGVRVKKKVGGLGGREIEKGG